MIENKLIQIESEEEEVVVVVASAVVGFVDSFVVVASAVVGFVDSFVVVASAVVGVGVSVSVSQPTLKAPGHRPSSGPQEMAKVTRSTMMISPSSQLISSSSPSILHSLDWNGEVK